MIEALPSGSIQLDRLTGIGGYPLGYITEIYGPAQCAKTSMGLSFIRENQEVRIATLVDAEYKFDMTYAESMGINSQSLVVFQSSRMNDIVDFVSAMLAEHVGIIVLDSIASVDATRGELWHLLSRLSDHIPSSTCVVWLNQVRTNIAYGEKVSYGGKSVRFYPALRVKLENPVAISSGREKIGIKVQCSIPKNVFAENNQTSLGLEIFYGKGTWEAVEIVDLALEHNLLDRRGSWYFYRDCCLGEGRFAAAERIEALSIYPSLIQTLRKGARL